MPKFLIKAPAAANVQVGETVIALSAYPTNPAYKITADVEGDLATLLASHPSFEAVPDGTEPPASADGTGTQTGTPAAPASAPAAVNIEMMTSAALDALAATIGITFKPNTNKPTKIDAIRTKQAEVALAAVESDLDNQQESGSGDADGTGAQTNAGE